MPAGEQSSLNTRRLRPCPPSVSSAPPPPRGREQRRAEEEGIVCAIVGHFGDVTVQGPGYMGLAGWSHFPLVKNN